MRTATVLRSVLAAAVFAGCGGAPRPISTIAAGDAPRAMDVARPELRPLGLELQVITARGDLRVRTDGDWQPIDHAMSGVREIAAARRGAILSIGHGDAAGRLWLRAGTRVRIGQADDGVHLSVLAGRARIRRVGASLPLHVDAASGPLDIEGDYVLEAAGGTTMLTPTAARPELAAWSLALAADDTGAGVGKMEAHGDDGKAEALALHKVSVKVTTHGNLAVTEVEHVFSNGASGGRPREGTFRFPVPDGAMLTGMAMEVDGKLVEGEIVERDKARQVYDEVVDSMQDPALLEWEEGNWFKLRVFPLMPGQEKRVVIRYTAPLTRGADGWEYDYGLAIGNAGNSGTAPGAIGEFSLTVDGKEVAHESDVSRGLDVAVPIAPDRVPVAMREDRADASYVAIRIAPDLAALTAAATATPRKVAFVIDTSRSALEGKALAAQELAATLGELSPTDAFVVLASDVAVTPSTPDLVTATPANIAAAQAFIAGIEPDGASDVGAALAAARALHPTDVVYIGDGIPTWGELSTDALGTQADAIGAPIHAALIGKGASSSLWSELSGRTGGRALIVHTAADAARFALTSVHADRVPRLAAARVTVAGDATAIVFPQQATTVYAGDELVALVKTSAGKVPATLTLTGVENGHPITQTIVVRGLVAEPGVAQRFGKAQIAAMEEQGADRDAIVATSRDLGVLSRYTSLLVLENDAAYKAHQIERKNHDEQLAQATPTVTGGDLDTLGARRASLSPDEIQPGDPEIKIPAPQDARSVVVAFPFGETKLAVWDDEIGAWMVRFLIDKETPDGEYQARVTITHADGRVEVLTLPYTVDTRSPMVDVKVERVAGGYKFSARQTGSARKDADKVELQLPDGSVLALDQTARGRFEGVWLTAPLGHAATLRVVARDHALNQTVSNLTVGPQ